MNNIDKICKEYGIENYTINEDGSIDVDGTVNLSSKGLTKLPLKFRNVTGYFDCSFNQLTALEGCPTSINGNFYCNNNPLTTLEGCPASVNGGDFFCDEIKELWNASSDVFKVLHSRDKWVINHNLWNL